MDATMVSASAPFQLQGNSASQNGFCESEIVAVSNYTTT
jgi:hypothetical protein